jgi:hypothetical protein
MPLSKFIHFTNANKHTISERTMDACFATTADIKLTRTIIVPRIVGDQTNRAEIGGEAAHQLVTARFAPWVADTGTRITRRQPRTGRGRDAIVNAASLASCDIAILISRNWLASMGSQCWICHARGCKCSTKN